MKAGIPGFDASARERMSTEVDEFMAGLQHPGKAEIEVLRALVLGADPSIRESIKWNAPSYYVEEHFATFKLHPPGVVQIIFQTGAKARMGGMPIEISDPAGLMKWVGRDRGLITFTDMHDIEAKASAFEAIVRQWIVQVQPASTRPG